MFKLIESYPKTAISFIVLHFLFIGFVNYTKPLAAAGQLTALRILCKSDFVRSCDCVSHQLCER